MIIRCDTSKREGAILVDSIFIPVFSHGINAILVICVTKYTNI